MKIAKKIIGGIIMMILLILCYGSFYTLSEKDQAVITQFGKPIKAVTTPGLHFKIPIAQRVNVIEKRILEWDGYPSQFPTKDKKFIWVDTFARWQIVDPILYFQRLRNERRAQAKLDDILDGRARYAVARYQLIELVAKKRKKIAQDVKNSAIEDLRKLGIALLDFEFKRINYINKDRQAVYARMISERKKMAAQYISEGRGEAAKIKGDMIQKLQIIKSEAYKQAKKIRGKADAEAAKIYAEAYKKNPTFYNYIKSLETLRTVLNTDKAKFITSDNTRFLRILQRGPKK